MRACLLGVSMVIGCGLPATAAPEDPYPSTYAAKPAPPTAIVGASVLTAEGPVLENTTLLFSDGKVIEIGQGIELPPETVVIDGAGKWVTPGIIDIHSHLGVFSSPGVPSMRNGNEKTGKNTAEVWAEHSIWPQDPGFEMARRGGVTTLAILPGSANLIGGRTVTVKNVSSVSVQGMKFPGAPYGAKMACGENPIVYAARGNDPFTRMGNMAGFRTAFIEAQGYLEKKKKGETQKQDLRLETIAGILSGEITTHIHCYRADEMMQMIDLSKEFGFKIGAFHHASEAYKIADVLAAEGIAVATWADRWGFKLEAYDGVPLNVAALEWAGVHTMLHSDSAVLVQRLNLEAAMAMASADRAGGQISREEAIRWITLNPAKTLGIADRTGSLAPGKMADLVLWSTDPFSVYAVAEKVFIDGVKVVDRDDPQRDPDSDFLLGQPVMGAGQ
ncbi:MAG: amidohydrolase family protein [Hyphomonas sp.]|uniref:amidohydrolase family protein n=1 Tax=Hyphomonas sp. TaxID=87 RepID=UPI00178E6813|nr:amidohydrolase family protein [Hyphomonas sp.]MBU3920173.1 amidohydrolase family protein [Alphaproteobacteria bacterium]MBU4062128.1 amidohydrolase family protein [Alphaproteobacteria bacterium]MBU4165563.1 amidohydrolase family protein [Alphaproteobacteria bacterium]